MASSASLVSFLVVCFCLCAVASSKFVPASNNEDSVLPWNEGRFQTNVNHAMQTVSKILAQTRNPVLPADGAHTYQDKYALAEYLSNLALATLADSLDKAFKSDAQGGSAAVVGGNGLTPAVWQQLRTWAASDASVTLRFLATDHLRFIKQETRKVDSNVQYVNEYYSIFGDSRSVHKTVNTVAEWFWNQQKDWSIMAFAGAADSNNTRLLQLAFGTGQRELVTISKDPPAPELHVHNPIDVDITWLLRQFVSSDGAVVSSFAINRQSEKCRTPRRNEQVAEGMKFFKALYAWSEAVEEYLEEFIQEAAPTINPFPADVFESSLAQIFNPIVPLIEEKKLNSNSSVDRSSLLTVHDSEAFLAQFRQSYQSVLTSSLLPLLEHQPSRRFFDAPFIRLLLAAKIFKSIAVSWSDSLQSLEELLRKQLVAAIGRQLTSGDFEKYMRYHAKKLFRAEYQPRPFSYAVRRDVNDFPEGTIAIESTINTGGISGATRSSEPIQTFVRHLPQFPMRFRLNAATSVTLGGERYVHTLLMHSFSGESSLNSLNLFARARQFSSFLLLLGKLASGDEISIQSAVLVKNGDEMRIPLLAETLPSAKAFKDAIASLSPEQQRFAKAYRTMQLDSSIFVLLTIQVKPQLEKVLRLSDRTLTKEIQLTQDSLEMFTTFQIPPDILAFDPMTDGADADANLKIGAVKSHVQLIQTVIQGMKKEQLNAAKQEKEYLKAMEDDTEEAPGEKSVLATASLTSTGSLRAAPRLLKSTQFKAMEANFYMTHSSVDKSIIDTSGTSSSESEAKESRQPTGQSVFGGEQSATESAVLGLPSMLDQAFEKYDVDGAVRPCVMSAGPVWTRTSSASLLARSAADATLSVSEQDSERRRSFELLDALSRSGALELSSAAVHILVAASHQFDKSVVDTVIEDNVNPIEKLERTAIIMQSVLQQKTIEELVKPEALDAVKKYAANNMFAAVALPKENQHPPRLDAALGADARNEAQPRSAAAAKSQQQQA